MGKPILTTASFSPQFLKGSIFSLPFGTKKKLQLSWGYFHILILNYFYFTQKTNPLNFSFCRQGKRKMLPFRGWGFIL